MQLTDSKLSGHNDPFTMLEIVTNRIVESEHDAFSKATSMTRLFKSIQATATVPPDIRLKLLSQTITHSLEDCGVNVSGWYFATESRQGYTLQLSNLTESQEALHKGQAHLHLVKSPKFGTSLFASTKYCSPLTVKSKRVQRVKSNVFGQISDMLSELGYAINVASTSPEIARLSALDSLIEQDSEHKTSRIIDLRVGASRQDAEQIASKLGVDYKQTRIVKTSSRYTIAGLDKK